MRVIDLTGQIFGRLTVVERAENAPSGASRWYCKCSCGGETITHSSDLRTGLTISCGCYAREVRDKQRLVRLEKLKDLPLANPRRADWGATYEGAPCKKCGNTTYYFNRKRCKYCQIKAVHNSVNKSEVYPDTPPVPMTCDCCKKPTQKFHLDHDHNTGKFRGWLCVNCNLAIGKLGDTLEGVMNAVKYLSG
jgi:hypothetical protein